MGTLFLEVLLRLTAPFLGPSWAAIIREEAHQGALSALRVDRYVRIVLRTSDFQKQQDVVVVGDSMVFGPLVRQEDLFTTLLSRQTGKSVLNLGISSSGPCTYNHMIRFALRHLAVPPRRIVYCLFANDTDEGPCEPFLDPDFYIWDTQQGWGSRLRWAREWLFQYSVSYQVTKRLLTFGDLQGGAHFQRYYYKGGNFEFLFAPPSFWSNLDVRIPRVNGEILNTEERIREGLLISRSRAVQFILVLMPCKEQVYVPDLAARGAVPAWLADLPYDGLYDQIKTWADLNGILTVDMRGPLRAAARAGRKVFWTLDGHMTPEGHSLVAAALASTLIRK